MAQDRNADQSLLAEAEEILASPSSPATRDILIDEELRPKEKRLYYRDEGLRRQRLINDAEEQNLKFKERIIRWVQIVVSSYLIFIAIVIGFTIYQNHNLSDNVLIALLTTTTVNIIGLPYLIIKALFKK